MTSSAFALAAEEVASILFLRGKRCEAGPDGIDLGSKGIACIRTLECGNGESDTIIGVIDFLRCPGDKLTAPSISSHWVSMSFAHLNFAGTWTPHRIEKIAILAFTHPVHDTAVKPIPLYGISRVPTNPVYQLATTCGQILNHKEHTIKFFVNY